MEVEGGCARTPYSIVELMPYSISIKENIKSHFGVEFMKTNFGSFFIIFMKIVHIRLITVFIKFHKGRYINDCFCLNISFFCTGV